MAVNSAAAGLDIEMPYAIEFAHTFTFEPVDGGTRLTQWCRLGPGRSGLNPAIDKMPDRQQELRDERATE